MNRTILILIITHSIAITPFIYLIFHGFISQTLQPYCLQPQMNSLHQLCISCFNPYTDSQLTDINSNVQKYMQYQTVTISTKKPSKAPFVHKNNEDSKQTLSNIQKDFNKQMKRLWYRTPFRILSIPSLSKFNSLQCNQILQMFDYENYNMLESLDTLKFQGANIPPIQQILRLKNINFKEKQIKEGKYHYQINYPQDANLGIVYKESTEDQDKSLIQIKYLDAISVKIWHISVILVGIGCAVGLIVYINDRKKSEQKINLIPNLIVILGIILPEALKIYNIEFDKNIETSFILDKNYESIILALFICLCFKKLNINRFVMLIIAALIIYHFNIWIHSVIIFITVITFVGYSSMFIQYQNHAIYLGSSLTTLILFKLYEQAFFDPRATITMNILILITTVGMEIVNQIPVEKFQQYMPVQSVKQHTMLHDDDQNETRSFNP